MRDLIHPETMRLCEADYFSKGIEKSIDVMERAANALAREIRLRVPKGRKIAFACGTGGNGGDGTACARLLSNDYDCIIVQPFPAATPDAKTNLARAIELDIPVTDTADFCADVWVDALFGTGLSRAPEGRYAEIIDCINRGRESGAFVASADIPSGLNGATGKAYSPCVTADLTVTFRFEKSGQWLLDGLDVCGELIRADVGFDESYFTPMAAKLVEKSDIAALMPPRKRNIHKNECGHLLIVAGSLGMAGAALLCASAALRSGAGLVSLCCPDNIIPILQSAVPGAMCKSLRELDTALKGKDAIVAGCGLSQSADPKIIEAVLKSNIPAIIDADGLNLVSKNPPLRALLNENHVLTPHPGEALRLNGDIPTDDPIRAARLLHEDTGATILYKGASCVITNGRETYISASGCNGMARGGSGDILAGIMGALLAEKSKRTNAQTAAIASEIHGRAGELAQEKYGSYSMNARDIIEFLREVFPK